MQVSIMFETLLLLCIILETLEKTHYIYVEVAVNFILIN